MTLDQLLNKTCLIGLTYMTSEGEVLKQSQLAGSVIKVDAEEGITVRLLPFAGNENEFSADKNPEQRPAEFHLPPGLEAWFSAPEGHYRQPEFGIDITNPDYFVTWDIVRKKDDTPEGKQEWWEWHPRTAPPRVN